MDKYRRVVDPEKDAALFPDDDAVVRIQVSGRIATYITYAQTLLDDPDKGKVELVALGRAINRAVTVAEILRRKVPDLHQLTTLRSISIRDRYEPIEEGLDVVEMERTSSCISITLAKGPAHLDTSAPGYAPPLADHGTVPITDELIAEIDNEQSGSASRASRGRAGSASRGRSRGRGRGGRGQRRDARRRDDQQPQPSPSNGAQQSQPPVVAGQQPQPISGDGQQRQPANGGDH